MDKYWGLVTPAKGHSRPAGKEFTVPVGLVTISVSKAFLSDEGGFGGRHFSTLCGHVLRGSVHFIMTDKGRCCRLHSFFPRVRSGVTFMTRGNTFIISYGGRLTVNRVARRAVSGILQAFGRLSTYSQLIIYNGGDTCISDSISSCFFRGARHFCRHLGQISSFSRVSSAVFGFTSNFTRRRIPTLLRRFAHRVNSIISPMSANRNSVSLVVPNVRGTFNVRLLRGL